MRILSIIIATGNTHTPDTFVLGQKPSIGINPVEDSPNIKDIKFFETSNTYGKVYRGKGFFVVEFEGSTVRRIIPAGDRVIDIAVEMMDKPANVINDKPIKGTKKESDLPALD